MQAILALMIGAFTFGTYLSFQDAVVFTENKAQELRIDAFKQRQADLDDDIEAMRERILRLEIIVE